MHRSAPAAVLAPRNGAAAEAFSTLRRVMLRIDAWLQARDRAAADREVLASMSDRELIDIGLDRAGVNFVAQRARMRDDDCPY